MKVEVTPVSAVDRERLAALWQLYSHDFSELVAIDVGEDGRFPTALDVYFTDPRRHAYLVRVDGKLAGFALVRQGSHFGNDDSVWDMVEFFVMRRYRRRGVGETVARFLFDSHRGRWEVRQTANNRAATIFWRRVIGNYTGGRFEQVLVDDDKWRGPMQRFDS